MALALTPEIEKRAAELLNRYPQERKKAAVLPLLHLAQDSWGYVSQDAMVWVARLIQESPVKVAEIATFYPMFNREPVGRYQLAVCHTLPCALTGCAGIVAHLSERLKVQVGQTTEDGKYTLKKFECLAACDRGPVMLVNKQLHTHMTPEKVDEILNGLE